MLKKQTVWLLTMLSLMIVLSVYYIMSDSSEYAFEPSEEASEEEETNDGDGNEPTESETVAPEQNADDNETVANDAEVDDISEAEQDELFTVLRMKVQDERGQKKERLQDIVTSSTASVDEKNTALNNMDTIDETSTKETTLEELIMSDSDYEDVFVRSSDDQVQIHVMGEEMPREEAVNIMKMTEDEFGDVAVNINQE